jgi:glycosyltransferase involved in cell wall biosynthesis
VLATKVGGIPEMIEDGKTGFLAPDDERSYAERLAAALEQKASWPAMGETARTVAHARFSSATMTDRYLELYQSVRGGTKP